MRFGGKSMIGFPQIKKKLTNIRWALRHGCDTLSSYPVGSLSQELCAYTCYWEYNKCAMNIYVCVCELHVLRNVRSREKSKSNTIYINMWRWRIWSKSPQSCREIYTWGLCKNVLFLLCNVVKMKSPNGIMFLFALNIS